MDCVGVCATALQRKKYPVQPSLGNTHRMETRAFTVSSTTVVRLCSIIMLLGPEVSKLGCRLAARTVASASASASAFSPYVMVVPVAAPC